MSLNQNFGITVKTSDEYLQTQVTPNGWKRYLPHSEPQLNKKNYIHTNVSNRGNDGKSKSTGIHFAYRYSVH